MSLVYDPTLTVDDRALIEKYRKISGVRLRDGWTQRWQDDTGRIDSGWIDERIRFGVLVAFPVGIYGLVIAGSLWVVGFAGVVLIALWACLLASRTPASRDVKRYLDLQSRFIDDTRQSDQWERLAVRSPAEVARDIYRTRAYREGWVDAEQTKMLIDDEVWRLHKRMDALLSAIPPHPLRTGHTRPVRLILRNLRSRAQALQTYLLELQQVDVRLAETEQDQVVESGRLNDLLAKVEGDATIAMTEDLLKGADVLRSTLNTDQD